eukprot:gene21507-29517_t
MAPYAVRILLLAPERIGLATAVYGAGLIAGALSGATLIARLPVGAVLVFGPASSCLGAALLALALAAVAADEAAEWDRLNAAYNERFGFPFILCIRRHGRDSALREFERRLAQDRPAELAAALQEIGRISRLRLAGRMESHGMEGLHGRLTTHALDIT